MGEALFIGGAAVLTLVAAGWILTRWVPQAAWLGVVAAIAARLLGAVAPGWAVIQILRDGVGFLGLAFAVIASLMGLWMAVVAVGMLYVALFRRDAIDDE